MLKTTLFIAALGAMGVTLVAARPHPPIPDGQEKVSDQKVSAGNADRLQVTVPLGVVRLIADGSRELRVHAVRTSRGEQDSYTRKWLNDSYLTASIRDGVLTVRDHPFGQDSLNALNNQDGVSHGHRDFDLKIEIHAPRNLITKLNVMAGEARLQGAFRSLNALVSAGNLTDDGIQSGKTELHVSAGKLSARLNRNSGGQSSLHVGAGEVDLAVSSGSSADISAEVSIGDIIGLPGHERSNDGIQLGDKRSGRLGSGGNKVDIHVGTGSIKIESPEKLKSLALSEESSNSSDVDSVDNDKDDNEIDRSVNEGMTEGLAEASKALDSIHIDVRLGKDKEYKDLSRSIERSVRKSLKNIGPEIRRALKEAQRAIKETEKAPSNP